MDLNLGEEQRLLVETARAFLARRCAPDQVRRLAEDPVGFDRELWREMAGLGWLGIELPEARGGAGQGFLETALLAEEMGRALLPSPFVPGIVMAAQLLQAVGNPEALERWQSALCCGDAVASMALVEPSWRDPDGQPALRAEPAGPGVALTGRKRFVPFAAAADVLIVSFAGPDLALVERGARGLACRRQATLGGDPVYEVSFDATPAARLGKHVEVAAALTHALDRGALASFAYATGAAERALELSLEHARTREQFGRPIGSFQAVAHRCVDMRSDIDALRYLVYQAAWALGAGRTAPLEVAAVRAFGVDALRQIARHAHQVHGAIGFSTEHDLHLYTRRTKATELQWGSASRAREAVASAMGL